MLTLLLVDDEALVIDLLRNEINWAALGISQVLCAYSMKQAKEAFSSQVIDIMLCDIEMPRGTGLELLRWVREEGYDTVNIFLTAHADFAYAKEAIALGSMDYIMKPIPFSTLTAVVQRAVDQVEKSRQASNYASYGKIWLSSKGQHVEHFFEDVLKGEIEPGEIAFRREEECRHIGSFPEATSTLLQMNLLSEKDNESTLAPSELNFSIKNIAYELTDAVAVIIPRAGQWLCILKNDIQEEQLLVEKVKDAMQLHLHVKLFCCLMTNAPVYDLAEQNRLLRSVAANRFVKGEESIWMEGPLHQFSQNEYIRPVMEVWSEQIFGGNAEETILDIKRRLLEKEQYGPLSQTFLSCFLQDFIQMLYGLLKREGIHSSSIFADEESRKLLIHASESVSDILQLLTYLVPQAAFLLMRNKSEESVAEAICRFIHENLDKDISREDIAAYVNLSPEYVSRIFRKEKGMMLMTYLQNAKVESAKLALSQTHQSVSEIAGRLGYENFSYFSKIFKKVTGATPQDYRKQYGKG